ncbi:hypothetical protein BpHYR1_045103 [Brachionus plicatilis]|uniref:Uncharacterized protein n=1 Tax=Brachionus plicatilis TaxID=10195 RepID=A0A3M7SSQ0_BRAPC|nr:hypothetical protein BpHYR1_045103 [Brachionus plicatilis]
MALICQKETNLNRTELILLIFRRFILQHTASWSETALVLGCNFADFLISLRCAEVWIDLPKILV